MLIALNLCLFLTMKGQNANDLRYLPINFEVNGIIKTNTGGLNCPQYSEADFNRDNKRDLFAFDRIGNVNICFKNTGTPQSYVYDAKFNKKIPQLNDWALMRDFNNDGAADIFTFNDGAIGGIRVFKGKYTNDTLNFDRMNFAFNGNVISYLLSNGTRTNLYVNSVDIPSIDDIDNDGDLDILSFEVGGGHVYWYKNMSIERGYNRDSLIYELQDDCWGKFLDNGFQPFVKLGTPTTCAVNFRDTNSISATLRHPGASITTFDIDNDGDKDAFLGSVSFSNLNFLQNNGSRAAAYIGLQDSNFPSNTEGVNIPIFPASFMIDINDDGLKDMVVAPASRNFIENLNVSWYYKNVGTLNAARFELQKKNFIVENMIDGGSTANPTMIDMNGDGLLDLIVGNGSYFLPQNNRDARLFLYYNVGTPSVPAFKLIDSNYLNLKSFSNIDVNNFSPTFGDLDNDSDIDLIVGEDSGTLFYFENTSNRPNVFTFASPQPNWKGLQVGSAPKPQIIDLNKDGLPDIVVGNRNGYVSFFKNVGTPTAPNFNMTDTIRLLGRVDVREYGSPTGFLSPQFINFNNKLILFCGTESGKIQIYDSIDNNLRGTFRNISNDYGKLRDGFNTSISIGNLTTSDSKLEMMIGNLRGGLTTYITSYNTDGTVSVKNNALSVVKIFPNPSNEAITVEINENSTLNIINILGEIIFTDKMTPPQYFKNISAFQNGIYFFRITNIDGKSEIFKIIKQ